MLDVKEEIYKTVENIVQRYYQDQKTSPQYSAVVVEPSRDKYIVLVNGSKYLVRDGVGISPAPNTPVYICVPNNDWNQAYICAGKKVNSGGGSGNVDDVYQNGSSVLGEDKIARISCATPADIQQLQANFQDGVDSIYDACVTKGSTPESHSLSDVVDGILNIETQGALIEKSITQNGTYNAEDDDADGYSTVIVNVPDYYGEVEPQVEDLNPITSGSSRQILAVYYHLAESTRPRFYATLNFTVSNVSSVATVYLQYRWDTNQSTVISQQYSDNGNKILTVDYLLPQLSAGDHTFYVTLTIHGGDIL